MSQTFRQARRSQSLYRRACQVFPGGVTRATITFDAHPTYMAAGSGARVLDVDGNEYIDFANNFTTLIHGHAFPPVVAAVQEQLTSGSCFANPTETEIELAELICARVPGIEAIRFVTSGTEAVMFAIKAARTFTGRQKIAKLEGTYHGAYDWAEVSETVPPDRRGGPVRPVPNYRGTPNAVLDDVVVVPFNDVKRAAEILDRHGDSLAAMLIDVMPSRPGLIPLSQDFVALLNDFSASTGALIISDEVLNFRAALHGAAAAFGLNAKLFSLGKIIGGGFAVGAVAGAREVMDVFSTREERLLPQGGTFAANPVTMVAGRVCLQHLNTPDYARLADLGSRARQGIRAVRERTGADISVTGQGSLFRIHPKSDPPRTYAEFYQTPEQSLALKNILSGLAHRGILLSNTGLAALSTPMGPAEIDAFLLSLEETLKERVAA